MSQKHQETEKLRTKTHCPQINISHKVSFEHQGNSVTKASGASEIENMVSLPSNQHFPQSLIFTSSATVSQKHQETQKLRTKTHCPQINISHNVSFEHQGQQRHKSIRRLRNKEHGLIALKSTFPTMSHLNHQVQQCHKSIRRLRNKEHGLNALKSTFPTKSHLNIKCNSVTKASGDSEIENKDSLPSNQHFPQSLI